MIDLGKIATAVVVSGLLACMWGSLPCLAAGAATFSAFPLSEEQQETLRQRGELERAIAARDAFLGKAAMQERAPLSKGISLGESRALVILVDFDDNPQSSEPEHFEQMLFSEGTYSTGSFRDYYQEVSYGKFDVQGDVVGWYRMPHSYEYYVNDNYGFGQYPRNAQRMVEDAIDAADPDVDFALYDNDHNGVVDMLIVVRAGIEGAGTGEGIWSHAWAISTFKPCDGVYVYSYATCPEDSSIGVYCHEFGHILGAPDLYDTDYTSTGVGSWSLMASGGHLNSGQTPAHFDAWCKIRFRWIEPVIVTENLANVSIPAAEIEPVVYKLWRDGAPENEYFLVENRQRMGFDQFLPGEGLLIYHVDDNVRNNRDEDHYKVGVEQADGKFELEDRSWADDGDPFPGASTNRIFDRYSSPSSLDHSGEKTNVAVFAISDSGDVMTADMGVLETEPELILDAVHIEDLGNGDGEFSAGEALRVRIRIENCGYFAKFVEGRLETDDENVSITSAALSFPSLGKGEATWSSIDCELELLPDCPCPHTVEMRVCFLYGEISTMLVFEFCVCSTLTTSFEDSDVFWEHKGLRESEDIWHQSSHRNTTPGGLRSAKCGAKSRFDDYAKDLDDTLISPIIGMKEGSTISFSHWLEAETDVEGSAVDVGFVEGTQDGENWFTLTPDGGYPMQVSKAVIVSIPSGTPCFSGETGAFDPVTITVPEGVHLQQFRFRFVTNTARQKEGWYIDDVVVAPPSIVSAPPVILAGGFFRTELAALTGGLFVARAFVSDPDGLSDIERVEVYYDGLPTGALLNDSGTGADDVASDAIFSFSTEIGGGLFGSGQHLFTISATDMDGNVSNEFPYLTVMP